MGQVGGIRILTEKHVFEPATFSEGELTFLHQHVGESPTVAMHGMLPPGVNPNMVAPALQTIYQFHELEEKRRVPWAGLDAIRASIERYMAWFERCLEIRRRGGPRHASMHGWDGGGRAHKFATGADAAEMVRSEINDDGEYVKFAVPLRRAASELIGSLSDVAPWIKAKPSLSSMRDKLLEDTVKGLLTCPICGFAKNYNPASRQSRSLALTHISKHLQHATKEIDRHRILYTHTFK